MYLLYIFHGLNLDSGFKETLTMKDLCGQSSAALKLLSGKVSYRLQKHETVGLIGVI